MGPDPTFPHLPPAPPGLVEAAASGWSEKGEERVFFHFPCHCHLHGAMGNATKEGEYAVRTPGCTLGQVPSVELVTSAPGLLPALLGLGWNPGSAARIPAHLLLL